jgi:hypothetical protein
MKPMTNAKARTLGKKELRAVFKSLRIKERVSEK